MRWSRAACALAAGGAGSAHGAEGRDGLASFEAVERHVLGLFARAGVELAIQNGPQDKDYTRTVQPRFR